MFFRDTPAWGGVVRWDNYINAIGYLQLCDSAEADTTTQEFLASEDTHISKRDFTGLDCDGWVYDLFRPDEPYAARGVHPSGVGIDRYIQHSDLTRQEKNYLHRQYLLSYLNLANPFLLEFRHFAASNPWSGRAAAWNLTLRHHLTSFGYTVDANLFWRQAGDNLLFTVHNYFNKQHYFPGFDLELVDTPVNLLGHAVPVGLGAGLWQQPEAQSFTTDRGSVGGHARLRLALPLGRDLAPYVEIAGKTAGWQAGTVYLQSQVEGRLGLRWTLR